MKFSIPKRSENKFSGQLGEFINDLGYGNPKICVYEGKDAIESFFSLHVANLFLENGKTVLYSSGRGIETDNALINILEAFIPKYNSQLQLQMDSFPFEELENLRGYDLIIIKSFDLLYRPKERYEELKSTLRNSTIILEYDCSYEVAEKIKAFDSFNVEAIVEILHDSGQQSFQAFNRKIRVKDAIPSFHFEKFDGGVKGLGVG